MYMEIQKTRNQYANTFVFRATSEPSLSQDDALATKSFSKKLYHEVYHLFLKQESGNDSVELSSDGAALVRRHGVSPDSVCCIELGEQCTFNVQHCFEAQYIHECDSDGGCVLEKWNPHHIMVDTYYQ